MGRTRLTAIILGTLTASALLAACAGGGGTPATGIAQGVTGVPDGSPFVDQRSLRFQPTTLVTKAGTAVYFKNSEPALHTVTINKNNESGNMRRNDVFIWTPPGPGRYAVTCEFHPQMKATITVE